MADQPARRRRRGLSIALVIIAIIVLVPLGTVAVLALTFDPDSAKPRIEAAVERATGRELALNGRLGIKWSLWPTIEAEDVAFANAAGGSRPQMATLQRMEAQVALLPLLRHEIEVDRLVLVKPDILLETDPQGRPNWRFGATVPAEKLPRSAPPAPAQAVAPRTPLAMFLRDVQVEGGTLTWRDGRTGRSTTVAIENGTLRADSPEAPIRTTLAAHYGNAPFTVDGTFGSLARVRDRQARTPWPVHVAAAAGNARLVIDGATTEPTQLRGYAAKVEATVPDLAVLSPFLRRATLPPLTDVRAVASVADSGNGVPTMTNVQIHAGTADLGRVLPGLVLGSFDASSPRLGDPVQVTAAGTLRAVPFTVAGQVVREGAAGLRVNGLKLTGPAGEVTGSMAMDGAGRPSLRADLAAAKFDVDALRGALRPAPAPSAQPAPPQPQAAPAPAPAPAARRVFSDRPIPFDALRLADADIKLAVGTLVLDGAEYRDIAGHLVLTDGRLTIDPAGAQLPAGRLDGRASVDASVEKPPVAVMLRGAGLHAAPLLALLGVPEGIRGNVDLDADLKGAGDTPHALAASASGHLGLAMVNGEIDNRLVSGTLGQVVQRAGFPDITARPGALPVRCLALRFDLTSGMAQSRALLLDTSLFYLDGGGSLDLGAETMTARLRPLARLGSNGIIVPLKVEGSMLKPKVTVDASGAADEAAGAAALAARGKPLGIIIGALGGNGMVEGGGGDDCARQLAIARAGLPGPAPAPLPEGKPKAPKPADLLRQFLR